MNNLEQLINEIKSYGLLGDNWDGEGSKAATTDNVNQALALLETLPPKMPLPSPMVSSDGSVGLYWSAKDYYIDIEMENNYCFSLYARSRIGESKEIFIDAIPINANTTNFLKKKLLFINFKEEFSKE